MNKPKVYFFGCMKNATEHDTEAGHYWRGTGTGSAPEGFPWGRYPDGNLCPKEGQPQGAAVLHQDNGWTGLAFWDRTGDSRGNSNSNFFAHGTFSFEEMCQMAQEAYPDLWKRFGTVRLESTNIPAIQGFVIKRVDDEHVEIRLHGHAVVSLSHDSDGWDGISRVEEVVESIGTILNITVRKE